MADQSKEKGFYCESCGTWHDGLAKDFGFQMPDEVWDLDYLELYERSRHNKDFCTLDGQRYFVRCLIQIPLSYEKDVFSYGVWIEVAKEHHDLHLNTWDAGADETPEFPGRVANEIPLFGDILGKEVLVKLYTEHRPLVRFPESATHKMAQEQRQGITLARHHDYVA